jgi:hypothetical protein
MNDKYHKKYLKYKNKYLKLMNKQFGGKPTAKKYSPLLPVPKNKIANVSKKTNVGSKETNVKSKETNVKPKETNVELKTKSTDESNADRNDNQLAKKSIERLRTQTLKEKKKKYVKNLDFIIETYNNNKCQGSDKINKTEWAKKNWEEKSKLVKWLNEIPFDAKWWEQKEKFEGHEEIRKWHSTEENGRILDTLPGPGLLKYISAGKVPKKEFCFSKYFIKDYLIDQLTESHEFLDEQNKILKFGICIKELESLEIILTAEVIAKLRSSISEEVSSKKSLVRILKKKVNDFFEKDPKLLVEDNIETIGDLIELIERFEELNVLGDFDLKSYKDRLLELEQDEKNKQLQLEQNISTLKEGMEDIKKQAEVKGLVEEIKKNGLDISKIEKLLTSSEFLEKIPQKINIESLITQKNDIDSLLELLENIEKLTKLNKKIGENAKADIEEILEEQLEEAINNLEWEEFKTKEKGWVEKIRENKKLFKEKEEKLFLKKEKLFLKKLETFEEENDIDTLVKNEKQKKGTGIIELDFLGPESMFSKIEEIKKNLKKKKEEKQKEQEMQKKMKDYEELSSKGKILYFYKLLDDFINSRVK